MTSPYTADEIDRAKEEVLERERLQRMPGVRAR